MKRTIKFNIVLIILVSSILLLMGGKSQAVLQANPTTHTTPVSKVGNTWITEIRQMETTGQTMGLNETLNGLNATSESNNIDVHMMLPTEYGAVAILSVSGYGNSGKLRDEEDVQKRTTTGNPTGVYFTGDRWEWMAATSQRSNLPASKYNNYSTSMIGSILQSKGIGILGWHDGGSSVKIYGGSPGNVHNSYAAGYNGIFSLGYDPGPGAMNMASGWTNLSLVCRGVAVVASEI